MVNFFILVYILFFSTANQEPPLASAGQVEIWEASVARLEATITLNTILYKSAQTFDSMLMTQPACPQSLKVS